MTARVTSSHGFAAPPAPGASEGLLGWVLLVLAGLLAVAAAGWYGYSLQQPSVAESSSAADTVRTPPRAAAGGAAASSVAAAAAPRAPAARSATPAAAGKAAPPASSASQPVLTWPLWEFQLRQPIPPRDPPLTPPSWRLIGATQTRDGWKVVVLRQGTTIPEYFGIGAMLPGGYKIRAITEEDVTFDINKREVILSYTGSR